MTGTRHNCQRPFHSVLSLLLLLFLSPSLATSQPTRLLRQPSISSDHVTFSYGADIWVVGREGGEARRITSTPAVESDPHLSPDGRTIAFTSNRSGSTAVYVVPVEGGQPRRLTWYPASSYARGWTPDGSRVLYSSTRQTAPTGYERLWTVSRGGGPSEMVPAPWGHNGSYAPDGDRLVVDRVSRWDVEWRSYRGGQNTPLVILDLGDLEEVWLPNERTTDIQPVWMGETIYFLSDRDWATNVWSYEVSTGELEQITHFSDVDVKWLAGADGVLILEHDGFLHTLDPESGETNRLEITVRGDFPWAEPRWENVSDAVAAASLSPTGKRVIMEARGEVFTVPVEEGPVRNLTGSSGVADRAPVWSPDGGEVAWFSDDGTGYVLAVGSQDGTGQVRRISIGESKMAWEPAWSPDGEMIAFVDDDTRIRVVDVEEGRIRTVDIGGNNFERTSMGLTWSPDSRWLAYAKTFPNNFRRIVAWSAESGEAHALTDLMADAFSPSWDRNGRHMYFLASTDLALGSGWANTSSIGADPTYGAYVIVLRADDPTPFPPESDEEEVKSEEEGQEEQGETEEGEEEGSEEVAVRIDLDGIERRVISLPMPVARYGMTLAGPEGTVFIGERPPGEFTMTLHKFSLEDREASEFTTGVMGASVSADGSKMLLRAGPNWQVVETARPPEPGSGRLDFELRTHLDRRAEWAQMFDEAWHYEKDFFYDPGLHGADWEAVRDRYRPLVPHVRHRSDLNYILDQMNGELSVGHSFVFGGDFPAVDTVRVGLLGADFEAVDGGWRIARIFTSESWNPGLGAPLDRPGLEVEEGDFLVGVDGEELTGGEDPYRLLDGTVGRQTVLHINDQPGMEGHWTVTVEPIRSENALRQRSWVEDNRRRVDELSGGRLGYVWVPNTGGPGVVSFDRYFFAQQDKEGAVIDERFNGGGNLDDYMVDLMTRSLRGAITNEAEGGVPFLLPAGILGPKVLLINEMAGSGGDYFPWAFRQQSAGPLIGTRTWGGLVRSSVHNSLIDGGALTSPDNAVFDPINNRYVAENEGVPPDIEVRLDARSVAQGRDPQLERGVQEALRLLEEEVTRAVRKPPFPRPHRRPGGGGVLE